MLAIWVSSKPEIELKQKACLAAFDISRAIHHFNMESHSFKLPTRIGLHYGHILIGNIGAVDRYEYRPVGDNASPEGRTQNRRVDIVILTETGDGPAPR